MKSFQRSKQGGNHKNHAARKAPVRVLSVGKIPDLLMARNELLAERGYQVTAASEMEEALAALHQAREIVVFGHRVPEHERNLIAAAARAAYPSVRIVMLYQGTIRNAHLGDALLSAAGDSGDLLNTIEHLLASVKSDRRAG